LAAGSNAVEPQRPPSVKTKAYLVGVDAAHLARPKSREVVRAFLTRFTDAYADPVSRVLSEEQRSHSERRRVEVYRLFRVFGAGFEWVEGRPSAPATASHEDWRRSPRTAM
jgi:hypothetical protein